jgi:hypothetical protein
MIEIFQNRQGISHDFVGFFPLHMTHEPDAAGVVLIARIIKALFRWESVIRHFSTKGGGI